MSQGDRLRNTSSRIVSGLKVLSSAHDFARPTVPRGGDLAESGVDAVGLADPSGAEVMPRIGARVE
jgi:hypothetical protein